MPRIKVYNSKTGKWEYADRSFGRIPVKGVDYYTEEEKNEFEDFIISELAKRGQVKPSFANSIKECSDISKLYVLPDGYIYAYSNDGGYTNLVSTSVDTDDSVYNGVGYRDNSVLDRSNSTVSIAQQSGYVTTGFIPMTCTDTIRMYGVEWTHKNTSLIAFYDVNKKPLGVYLGNGFIESPAPEYFDGVHRVTCLGSKTAQSVTTENGESTFNIVFVGNNEVTQNPDRVVAGGTVAVGAYNVKYVRISAYGNGADMVVTVNEEIYGNEPSGYAWRNTGHAFVPTDYEDRIISLEEKQDNMDITIKNAIEEFNKTDSFDATTYGLPILRVTGDVKAMTKENKVPLNYVYGDLSGSCEMKWQGSSSIKWPKKNYTITFKDGTPATEVGNEESGDGFVAGEGFIAHEGWGRHKKYCLKANYIDFSHSRNIVNAKLWGQIVKSRKPKPEKLCGLINGGAIDGFPICLFINDEYQGIYTFNIPKDGWLFDMKDNQQEAVVCAGGSTNTNVVAFRKTGVILDVDVEDGSDTEPDFDLEYTLDEDNTGWINESLNTMISACLNSDGTDLDTVVSQYLDLDSAIDYIIFTVLQNGFDGLYKNYLLATYDGVKWFFSAYDMDSTHGLHWDGTFFYRVNEAYGNRASIKGFCDANAAFNLIRSHKKDALKARYKELRADILSEDNLATEFINFLGKIPKALFDKECTLWKNLPSTSTNNLSQIVDFYRRKCAVIDAEMNSL